MRLLRVELRRLSARRLLRVMVLVALVAVAVTLGKVAYDSHPPNAAQLAQAEQLAAEQRRQNPPIAQQVQECENAKAGSNGPPKDYDCAANIHAPRASDFVQDRTFRFRDAAPSALGGFSVILALVGFLVGASFVGAEWSAGTMGSLLTWEPRRLRVLAAKGLALAIGLSVVGVVLLGSFLAGAYGVAEWRGSTAGATSGFLMATLLTVSRGVALGVGAALGGFAVAGTLRSTSAALGLGFAYFVGAEIVLRNAWKGSPAWLLTSNVGAWLIRDFHIDTFKCPPQGGDCTQLTTRLSHTHGALVLLGLTALVLAIAAVTFRRRDVS